MIIFLSVNSNDVMAQNAVCAYCGTQLPYGVHGPKCKYYVATSSSSSSVTPAANLSTMVAGAIFQNMLKSIFSNNSAADKKALDAKQQADQAAALQAARQAAQQQRINQAIAQAEYEKMMKSYKLLEGSQDLKIKTLGNTNLEFKTLNGNAETLSADARNQFENGIKLPASGTVATGGGTPFFGDTMPIEDLQTLVNTDSNPNVVDLREATKYVEENKKNDSLKMVSLLRKAETPGNGSPIIQKPDCIKLGEKLKLYSIQRDQFQKTINLSKSELDVWETANRNALINAAKDGLEYFTGQLLDRVTKRAEAAERLQRIYNKNVTQMTKDGINVVELQTKIEKLRILSTKGKISELTNNINDWQTFMKDGMSSLVNQFTDSNKEITDLMEDPKMKSYFESEKPELKTLLDISKLAASNKVFGKWVAKKVPMIALVDISIKQLYNGLDYFLSLNRIMDSNKINGKVMDAAYTIQKNINETSSQLRDCN